MLHGKNLQPFTGAVFVICSQLLDTPQENPCRYGAFASGQTYQYFDKESNLHYNWMRSYSPNNGRYTQADPIDLAGGWNKFGYAYQNTLMYSDPYGLWPTLDDIAFLTPQKAADAALYWANKQNQTGNWGYAIPGMAAAMVADHYDTTMMAMCSVRGSTSLYQKVGPNGEHLKFGIANDPATRYTSQELGGWRLKILAEGTRPDMLKLERNLHENLPIGPQEGQKFYIQKQIERGLIPPPYKP